MDGGVTDGVGLTALGVAWLRAQESRRADRLFTDPYAAVFLAAAPGALPEVEAVGETMVMARFAWGVVLRTRFFDDYLVAATETGCRQVVLLAAGLDTRAFRLSWPAGVRLYELDLPEVIAFKERVLADVRTRCTRTVLAADLCADWPAVLRAAGFEPAERTAWLAEGLLIYLTRAEASGLLTAISACSAPGSRLSLEHPSAAGDAFLDRVRAMPQLTRLTALWRGGLGADTPAWLSAHGWQVELTDRVAYGESLGRPGPDPSGAFLSAVRQG